MPLKPLSYREIKRKLEMAGFEIVSQKGSHVKFAKDTSEGKRTTIVPKYKEI
jgi:predicted RNA binding protein YcfA (HicA-like mRNA interferase family)